ncbi:MAG: T9SS type A sorting domain-containing protein [Saprospiraceae bacterium]|nr:T9SS type A sorting domain-containing protein [Saprospiraceae bacterium]
MNHKLYPVFVLLASIILLANSGNPPNGNTGAPGDGVCSNCHSGNPGGLDGSITIAGLPSNINTNTKYTLTVTVENLTTAAKGGCQIVALDQNNNNIGTFSNPGTSSTLQTSGGRTYFEHNPAKSFAGPGSVSYTVDWTSPTNAAGQTVTIYGACILANGNSSSSNDLMKLDNVAGNMPGPPPLGGLISAFKNISCNGGVDGSITAMATNGVPPYSYLWSDGQTTSTAIGLSAKMYSVTISDNLNAMVVLSKLLTEPPAINIAATGKKALLCFGNKDGNLNVNSSGGTGIHSYKWNTGAITKNIANLVAGDYTVTVTDGSNCTTSETYSITQPDEISIETKIISYPNCSNDPAGGCEANADGGSGSLKYKWSSGEVSSIITDKLPGIYSVTVTDANNCTKTKSINIIVKDLILPQLSIQQDTFSYHCNYVAVMPKVFDNCGIKSIQQLEGIPVGDTFKIGVTRMRFKAIDSSNNEVELSYNIEVRNPLKLSVDTFTYDSCKRDINIIQFTMENISNSWYELLYNGDKKQRYDSNQTVVFLQHQFEDTLISLIDSFNCTIDTVVKFDTTLPDYFNLNSVEIKDASECKINDGSIIIVIDGKIEFSRWLDKDGIEISNQSGKQLYAGTYYYEVSSGDKDDTLACRSVFGPFEIKCTTGSQAELLKKLDIFPNPVSDNLLIENRLGLKLNIRIYSITGAILFSTASDFNSILIDASSFSSGFYFIEFQTENLKARSKIMIVK